MAPFSLLKRSWLKLANDRKVKFLLLFDKFLFIESIHQCGFCTGFLSRDFVNQFSVIKTNRGSRESFSWWVEKEKRSDTRLADFFVSASSKRRKSLAQTASLSWHKINDPQFSNLYFCGLEIRKLIFESSVMEWRSNLLYAMNQSSIRPCQNISSVFC